MKKESHLDQIESPDFTKIMDEIYDGYVIYYSEAGGLNKDKSFDPSKIQALTTLMQIISGLEKQIPKKEQLCENMLSFIHSDLDNLLNDFKRGKYSFHPETLKALEKQKKSKIDYLESFINSVKNQIEVIFSEIKEGNYHKFDGLDREIREIKGHFLWLEHYVLDYKFHTGFADVFNEGVTCNANLFKFTYHINSLNNITAYIIQNNYPEIIPGYDELSKSERDSLTDNSSKRGNPNFIKEWKFTEEFIKSAELLTAKDKYDQKSIYNQLVVEFYSESKDKPSYSTVRRKLKEEKVW